MVYYILEKGFKQLKEVMSNDTSEEDPDTADTGTRN